MRVLNSPRVWYTHWQSENALPCFGRWFSHAGQSAIPFSSLSERAWCSRVDIGCCQLDTGLYFRSPDLAAFDSSSDSGNWWTDCQSPTSREHRMYSFVERTHGSIQRDIGVVLWWYVPLEHRGNGNGGTHEFLRDMSACSTRPLYWQQQQPWPYFLPLYHEPDGVIFTHDNKSLDFILFWRFLGSPRG